MNDPLDVTLNAKDITDMEPQMVVNLYDKVRQSRSDIMRQRAALEEDLEEARDANAITSHHNKVQAAQITRYQIALAEVAIRMIEGDLLYGDPS